MQTFTVFKLRAYSVETAAEAIAARAPARVDYFGVMMTARYATTRPADLVAQYHRIIGARVAAYWNNVPASMRARMVCGGCGATGCKMWREYQTCADYTKILCGSCAMKDQKKTGSLDADGKIEDEHVGKCDQIGWLVPAVPTFDGSFWGYTSVPAEGCAWVSTKVSPTR